MNSYSLKFTQHRVTCSLDINNFAMLRRLFWHFTTTSLSQYRALNEKPLYSHRIRRLLHKRRDSSGKHSYFKYAFSNLNPRQPCLFHIIHSKDFPRFPSRWYVCCNFTTKFAFSDPKTPKTFVFRYNIALS